MTPLDTGRMLRVAEALLLLGACADLLAADGYESAAADLRELREGVAEVERRGGLSASLEANPASDRWLTQTRSGGGHMPPEERGDCVSACIASILGLPINAIANTHGDGWWERLQGECAKHGYALAVLDMQLAPPPSYWVASVPSLNLPAEPNGKPALHCVVARFYDLVHDPSAGERYDAARWVEAWDADRIAEGWVLVPLDPVEASR